MKVLFLIIRYPNISKDGSMYTDLAEIFQRKGHEVYVATGSGNVNTKLGMEGEIKVLRVKTGELFGKSLIKKGIANVLLPFHVYKAIKKYFIEIIFDALIVPTPPITYSNVAKRLKKQHNCPVYLILRDIFPQNARDLGIMKNPLLFWWFRMKEKDLYRVADFIGCMSLGNINYLKKNNHELDKSKLHLLSNWKDIAEYSKPHISIKHKFGLENRFIALYGGNLGKPQKIEFILDLAKELSFIDDVVFLLIGYGTEKDRIKDLVKRMHLSNVILKDPLPRYQYQELAKICDLGLVNLSERFTVPNIPSRTLSYWEAKLPILASTDSSTDFNKILEESGSGLWSLTGDIDSYKHNFMILYNDKALRLSMGEKGYKYLMENCTSSKAYNTIIGKLSSNSV